MLFRIRDASSMDVICVHADRTGRGEFGEVLLAKAKGVEEGEVETVVLVKSLQAREEQLRLDFGREVEMFGRLRHPNVVRLLGLCQEAEPHYMILEYVDLVRPPTARRRPSHPFATFTDFPPFFFF